VLIVQFAVVRHDILRVRGNNADMNGNIKVKVTFVQALRFCTGRTAHRGSRGISTLS